MTSVAASHTSSRSRKSSKHDEPRSRERSKTPDVVEKLIVKTVDIQLEPNVKTDSPRPEVPAETLAVMVGEPSRRSRCAAEFLLEMAKRSSSEIYEEFGKKFNIISGSEAVTFYKKFLGGKSTAEILATKESTAIGKELPPFVVFAITTCDAGRRLVDYYTTWRGKMNAKDLTERRLKFLDSQFRKAARVLDNEFKRVSIYGAAASVSGSTKSSKSKKDSEEPPAKTRPPSILAPPPELKVDAPKSPSSSAPLSATDSVMSLPFLNMIRGVPLGHRVPLRVTNPDRLSMISSSDVVQDPSNTDVAQPVPETALPPISETEENLPAQKLLTPEVVRTSRLSIRSSHSKESTKSSAASTASTESRRSKHKVKEIPEFLIVLLDDRIDKDTRTWHGLERQVSRTSARTTPSRVSLWDGPLARDNGITYSTPPARPSPQRGEESSEEEDWENSPVIPMLPDPYRMTRSASETRHLPMIPAAVQYRMASANPSPMVPLAGLPGYNQTPSPYPPSPYVQPYASPYHSPILPPSMRPLSRSRYQPPAFHP